MTDEERLIVRAKLNRGTVAIGRAGEVATGDLVVEGSRDAERIRTVVVPGPDQLAVLVAERIVEVVRHAVRERGQCVLGLASGTTPIGVYRELVRRNRTGAVDFSRVVTFNLDEYYPMSPDSVHSYRRFMEDNLFNLVNLPPENVHTLDGTIPGPYVDAHCAAFEEAIRDAGGIDFQIVGIGRDGHIGFNEPGSPLDCRTRLVALDGITRRDAAVEFSGLENVPPQAITMGIATILEAREIALIATGEHKASIVRKAVEEWADRSVPASFVQRHSNATVFLDLAAARELTRVKTPWLVGSVEWTPEISARATVWLAERAEKSILKLSNDDYRRHRLNVLLERRGPASRINEEVFKRLQGKIRQGPDLARKKRILVFAPRPDAGVLSAGGILQKLARNGNEVIVIYMTSGNVMVSDHEVRRHLEFVQRASTTIGIESAHIRRLRLQLERELAIKEPAHIDSKLVRNLRRFIRESEAVAALAALGLPRSSARFLNMPFNRRGGPRPQPASDEDVAIILYLLRAVRPDQIFLAGDRSDLYGTNGMCRRAIEAALQRYDTSPPEVWLYRSQATVWSPVEADVLIPLSPEELRAKTLAISRHESQREISWPPNGRHGDLCQQVHSGCLQAAARADSLGLPEYYALEAYRVATPTGRAPAPE